MARQTVDDVQHSIRMLRHYSDRLAVHAEDGGTFTSEELHDINGVVEQLDSFNEPSSDTNGPGEAGDSPANP